ncbi:c-type cytochrome biogenesis protein CcmI [Segnochrobactraceae bacterium EtOH-i3]
MFGPVLLWAVFALLTAAAVLSVLWPLSRRPRGEGAEAGTDQALYAEQIDEIERSRASGELTPAEADAARAEVGRRLLAAARRGAEADGPKPGSRVVRVVATLCIVCIPLGALAVYGMLGAPSVPDAPRAARLDGGIEGQSIGTLVARVEDHLMKNPNDVRGWAAIAPIYLRLGRGEEAANAFQTLIGLQGPTADNETGLGEALALAAGGVVTADARAAFEKAAELDPANVKPRFYLAMALSQEGRTEDAKVAWDRIIASAKGDEPWLEVAKVERARLDPQAAPMMGGAAMPGPSSEDVKAAAGMSTGDRQTMIEGMVSRLSERLASEGGTPEEWARLVRAQMVLGRRDAAAETLKTARAAFPDNAAAQETLNAVAGDLETAPAAKP